MGRERPQSNNDASSRYGSEDDGTSRGSEAIADPLLREAARNRQRPYHLEWFGGVESSAVGSSGEKSSVKVAFGMGKW